MLRQNGNNTDRFKLFSCNQPSQSELFDTLFKYIKNNTKIPKFLSAINAEDPFIIQLNEAINHGDVNATIFSHPDCYLYLLYLIQKEMIDFWHGMTTYLYLMVLMQFTSKQNLRADDKDIKMERDITLVRLVSDQSGELTEEGLKYLKFLSYKSSDQGRLVDLKQLKMLVLHLPNIEQWLIKIPCKIRTTFDPLTGNDFDDFVSQYLNEVPYLRGIYAGKNREGYFYIPSFSIIRYFVQNNTPYPMLLEITFGSVKVVTLQKLHRAGIHPGMLYAPGVISNTATAHEFRCGPVGVFLHDLLHQYIGSFLDPIFKKKLFDFVIPQFEILKKLAQEYLTTVNTIKLIENIIDSLYDFDLLGLIKNIDKDTICTNYLGLAIKSQANYDIPTRIPLKIGEGLYDILYFLIESRKTDNEELSSNFIALWKTVTSIIRTQAEDRNFMDAYFSPNVVGKKMADEMQHLANGSLDIKEYLSTQPDIHEDFKLFLEEVNDKKLQVTYSYQN